MASIVQRFNVLLYLSLVAPLALQAPRIKSRTWSTPLPCLTAVNTVGPLSRILAASRAMTSKEAPTSSARSIYQAPGASATDLKAGGERAYLVDDQKIGLRNPRSAFPRNLISSRNIDLKSNSSKSSPRKHNARTDHIYDIIS